jgi:lambda family phage portal protein
MNIIDRIVAFFSPRAAVQRAASRIHLQQLTESRSYEAATNGRRTSGWTNNSSSPNTELQRALPILRARSRDLEENNPYMSGAMDKIPNNVVGTGIRPTPITENKQMAQQIERLWKKFVRAKNCDFNNEQSFYELQWLVMRTIALSGEVLVRKRTTTDKMFPFKIQLLEPDFFDIGKNYISTENDGSKTILGVKYDKQGKKLGYWLYDEHPSESAQYKSSFYTVDEVLHIKVQKRPGQVRGIPFAVPSMARLKNFDGYEDAELMRLQTSACFSVFITEPESSLRAVAPTERLEQVQPGIIEHLPPGKQVSFASPPQSASFADYSRQVLSGISQGVGLTYEMLTGDLSNVSFTSGRMGWLEFAKNVYKWQQLIENSFCIPVWEWFIQALELSPMVEGEEFRDEDGDFIAASWTYPRREMIDPVAETKALNEQVRAGFISYYDAVKMLGGDPEKILAEQKRHAQEIDAAGLMPTSDPRYDSNRAKDKAVKEVGDTEDVEEEDAEDVE